MTVTTKIDRLNNIFQWLLAPTTFLMLVSWNYTNYLVTVGMAHPDIFPNFQFQESYLLLGSDLLIYEVTIFGLSIFAFLLVVMREQGKLSTLLRFFAFWGLLFTLTLIWFTFAQARLVPIPSGNIHLLVSTVISFLLTFVLFWNARTDLKFQL